MPANTRIKRRGFVMTGGGAKGLYEAGVIHAFHITGMEFDAISGSSIGAMNAVFYAEYLLRKRSLPPKIRANPEKTIEQMENLVRCYHRTWLLMPAEKVIDDSPNSALGKLVGDLEQFRLDLADLVTLGWWNMDPEKGKLPPVGAWPAISRIFGQLLQRLGTGKKLEGARQLLRIWKDHRSALLPETMRSYLRHFGLEFSIIPTARAGVKGEDDKIEAMFTRRVAPLQPQHLSGSITELVQPAGKEDRLLDPARTIKDFIEKEIDLRLTRANYRTGRLEVSAYLSPEDFLRYMEKQAWRLEVSDPEKMPLGSFRLQLPGNPSAIKAALASGRFPGVFAPFPFQEIYPQGHPENRLLYKLLEKDDWLSNPDVQQALKKAYFAVHGPQAREAEWQRLLGRWQKSAAIRQFFPYPTDTYVDGGAIDNTPSNSIVDATRERLEAEGTPKRDAVLEMYVIFLETEPRISRENAQDPLLYEVVQRTLAIQSAAVKASDAVVVDTINSYGERGEQLARSLLAVLDELESVKRGIDPALYKKLEAAIRDEAARQEISGYRGSTSSGVLKRMRKWGEDMLASRLPLHVEEIKIYPDRMTLSTLQFTERLGYRKENAIEMITMGCYNTLWSMRNHLENLAPDECDELDEIPLRLSRRWMGIEAWPRAGEQGMDAQDVQAKLADLRDSWQCTRVECLFHAEYCAHGARMSGKVNPLV